MTQWIRILWRRARMWPVTLRLKKKWKKTGRRDGCVNVRVGSVVDFLNDLEAHGIQTCVLRWPDRVPTIRFTGQQSKQAVDAEHGDVDLLLSVTQLNQLLPVAARHKVEGGIQCELYSVAGVKGTQYLGYPYYPPLRAQELLAGRVRHGNGFYCLAGRDYIFSLAFHLVYHKGLASGLPMLTPPGTATEAKPAAYALALQREAEKAGVTLPGPLTLESLEAWLRANGWHMPFDLLMRWQLDDAWMRHLIRERTKEFAGPVTADYQFVYVLREDLEGTPLEAAAEAMLAQKFSLVRSAVIPKPVRREVASWLRGGKWGEGGNRKLILPHKFVLCTDPHPVPPGAKDDRYPHVDNMNFYFKHEVRTALSAQAGKPIFGVHGSDNQIEARYMLSIWKQFLPA